jgi:ketosteroid isomerase-like protein
MMTTESRTAADVVRAYFEALQQGQFDSVGALFADDVRWHQPGDLVAATLHFYARRGTEQIAMDGVDVLRVRDGQIAEAWLFSADQSAEDAFWSRA